MNSRNTAYVMACSITALLSVIGCNISDQGSPPSANNTSSNNTDPDLGGVKNNTSGDDMTGVDMNTPAPDAVPRAAVRRLTSAQYSQAVGDLFGERVKLPDELEPDPAAESAFTFSTVLSRGATTDDAGADRYARTSAQITRQIFEDAAWRVEVVGCEPSAASDPCVSDYLRGLMRRAWSRPVDAAELARYVKVVSVGAQSLDVWTGLSFATSAVLESPNFLYRTQLGQAHPDKPGIWRFSDHEMADRLALLLWGSVPDEALLKAADEELLTTTDGLRAQTERMLEDPRAERGVMSFLVEWFGLEGLEALSKDEDVYPKMSHTLGHAMREEIEHYFRVRALEQDQDFLALFTSRQVRINDELRQIYGIQEPVNGDGWEERELPETWERGGLLTSPGIMALNATRTRTSPTLRGLYVLERLLCLNINPAPDGLNVDDFLTPQGQETIREWNARFRQNQQCAGCHNLMDPIGLVFGRFNGIGQHSSQELGMDIDPSGTVLGQPISDAKALGEFLSDAPQVQQCVVRQLMRYANGQREVFEEEPLVVELTKTFRDEGNRIKPLLLAFILSAGFRETAPLETP